MINSRTVSKTSSHSSWAQGVVFVTGLGYLLVGLTQLIAPFWFFEEIGNFPPFNRHYVGDLGSFTLPLGLGLLLAARDLKRQWLLLGVVTLISLLHALNHVYDAIISQGSLSYWLTDPVPLLVAAILLILVMGSQRE
jgi:hypothetical protein